MASRTACHCAPVLGETIGAVTAGCASSHASASPAVLILWVPTNVSPPGDLGVFAEQAAGPVAPEDPHSHHGPRYMRAPGRRILVERPGAADWLILVAGNGIRKPGRPACLRAALDVMLTRPVTKTGKAWSPQRTARRIAGEI
jgi:hypothetical protein